MKMRAWFQRYGFAIFVVLTLLLSWWPWVLGFEGFPLLPLGPMVAALIVVALANGWAGLKNLARTSFRWRVELRWYAVAIGFPIVLLGLPAAVNILLGATADTGVWPTSIMAVLQEALGFFLLVALGEEVGFSSYGLPHLLRQRSILVTVLILGLLRAVWHLPAFLTGETQWAVAVLLFPMQLIFTWIFIRSRGSGFLLILSHLTVGVIGFPFFTALFSGLDLERMVWLQAAAFLIAGGVLLATSKLMRSAVFAPDDPAVAGELQALAAS